jgi:hypothetical protein
MVARAAGGCGQASVNPKAETVEELQGRRKGLHMGMLKLAREDLALALQAEHDSSVVQPQPNHPAHAILVGFTTAHTSLLPTPPRRMHTALQAMCKHAAWLQPRAACETWLRSRQTML